jgi:hypothetical protein
VTPILAPARRGPVYSVSWLSSQIGARPVRLQVQKNTLRERRATYSTGSKPEPLWLPSQNGWLFERPQAHHQ